MYVVLVTGTRPQIIKSAPVLTALEKQDVEISFIHTGQHYDYEMAAQFIEDLSIRKPDENLDVGSGVGVYHTQKIIRKLAKLLDKHLPDYLIVPGDTDSALAAALTGFKMNIPTCHLEAGLRSYDMRMQEEINRRLIDHGSSGLFAPTDVALTNLEEENVRGDIFHTGDTMYDVLKEKLPKFSDEEYQIEVLSKYNIDNTEFAILTIHRRENVDFPDKLQNVVKALSRIEQDIVFPIHPRTASRLEENNLTLSRNVKVLNPISYSEMMALLSRSSLLITDSGGLQKEAYLLNTPCVTIRDNTEWLETIYAGANILTTVKPENILQSVEKMWGKQMMNDSSVYGNGKASYEIVNIIVNADIEIKGNLMIQE